MPLFKKPQAYWLLLV